ncbi:hypothetical protein JOL79_27125 [Microbispora sp. RL4-1S]|uniref:Alpha/beta hydrolase n=1 Tax=Microbispora oryzae TaxID=2806554 RepID=A0A940WL09_9ACTN|nr:hypothetical protein [Microbispora oryzae]MBP2707461.1 hypothetical protein [Microbispora oryzae]
MRIRGVVAWLAALSAVVAACVLWAPASWAGTHKYRPVIFVHGFSGSGAQFETQARRLTGNGYPIGLIESHDYDSLFQINTREQVYAGLDARTDRLLAASRADKVDLLTHSLGTGLMQEYLRSSPQRAAKVAHYVNLDGSSSADQPGGVPTLAVWGEGSPDRQVGGAVNVRFPDQSHTQVVSSEETFAKFFEFFTGRRPRTTDVQEERGNIRLSRPLAGLGGSRPRLPIPARHTYGTGRPPAKLGSDPEGCRARRHAVVESARGAVSGLLSIRFPGPLAEPAVPISRQRALHGLCRQAGFAGGQGLGILVPR